MYRVLVGKPEGKAHLGDPTVDGRIILTLRLLMSYIYMELLVKPEMLTSYT